MEKMKFNPQDKATVREMVAEVLNTRDFCGNEFDVYKRWSRKVDITEAQWFNFVITEANRLWNACR